MNNVLEIVQDVEARGVVLKTDGERIFYRPKEAVTQDVFEKLRMCKEQIIRLLSDQRSSTQIFSRVLDRHITISWRGENPKVVYVDDLPYNRNELRILKGTTPEAVRKAHLVKEMFCGEIRNEDHSAK